MTGDNSQCFVRTLIKDHFFIYLYYIKSIFIILLNRLTTKRYGTITLICRVHGHRHGNP